VYPRGRVIAYVMPTDRKPDNIQLAARSQPNHTPSDRSASEPGIDSPITELLAAIEAEQNRPERPSPNQGQKQIQKQIPQPSQPRPAPMQQASLPPRPSQPVPQAEPAEPHRSVQQISEPIIVSTPRGRRALPLDPGLAEFLGITARAQDRPPAAPQPRAVALRQRQVQQNRPRYIANAGSGLTGVFGLR
jgi:hypothetical protein